jgi:hypothetical protein
MTYRNIICLIFSSLLAGLLAAQPASAEDRRDREMKIKAAFLHKFTKFITWPDTAGSTLTICLLEDDPFEGSLQKIAILESPTVEVVRIVDLSELSVPGICHLLYLDSAARTPVEKLLGAVRNRSIVTVSDRIGFVASGGIIELFEESNNVFFKINLAVAQRENVKISSRLLSLAKELVTK